MIGFRITDLDGICIQGTDADPFGLPADAVLVDGAILTAKGWAVDRGVLVSPVFAPDADGIEIVDAISIEQAPSPAMR